MDILDHLNFDQNQILTALIALGLLADGLIKKLKRQKPLEIRGCLYGDAAHDKLMDMLNDLHEMGVEAQEFHRDMHDVALEMVLILRRLDK